MQDVVKTQQKPNPNGRPRRRKRNMSLYYLMLISICVVIFLILSRTIFFNINEYIVDGNKIYSDEQILNAGGLRDGRNMYGINLDHTAERIKNSLIYIEDVSLRRKLPDKFIVEVQEATAYACCEYEGSRYAIITKGGRYLETEQLGPRAGMILITGMELKNVALGEEFESEDENKRNIILDLLESISEICDGKITSIDITDRTKIRMVYEDRIDIDFGSSLDYEYKLRYITTIIEQNLSKEDTGRLIYHSAAAGASFIRKEDLELNEQDKQAAADAQNNAPETDEDGEEQSSVEN